MQYRILKHDLTPGEIISISFFSNQKPEINLQYIVHDDNDEYSLGAIILLKDRLPCSEDELHEELELADEIIDVLRHNSFVKTMLNLKGDPLNPTPRYGKCLGCGENVEITRSCCNNANILYNGTEIRPIMNTPGAMYSMKQYPDGKID